MPRMKRALVPFTLVFPLLVATAAALNAQAPVRPPNQANQPNQPAPRDTDGHIFLGPTAKQKGVWIGGNLGFCKSNTVAAPTSLNPGAPGGPGGAQPAGRGAPIGPAAVPIGLGRGNAGPCTPIPY